MHPQIASITLIVDKYDEAIAYFVNSLGFELVEDAPRDGEDRWVVVVLNGGGPGIRLAEATDERQRQTMGAQAGGRVFIVLYTDDLLRDHVTYLKQGVRFLEEPRKEP
jgi:catechol 2,3-dioxygenase-like lactoylglutathione lyase family enzyme